MENGADISDAPSLLPAGAKFMPTATELVEHYLYNYIHGIFTPTQCYPVQESDHYGENEPWELWKDHQTRSHSETNDVYLFTKLKKKAATNFVRTIGNAGGNWHGEVKEKTCTPEFRGRVDGFIWTGKRRKFTYRNNREVESENGKWILYEYRIGNFDTVVCTLRNNGSPAAAEAEKRLVNGMRKRKFEEILGCIVPDRRIELISVPARKKLQCHRDQSNSTAIVPATPILVENETTSFGDAIVPVQNETAACEGAGYIVLVPLIPPTRNNRVQSGVEEGTAPFRNVSNMENLIFSLEEIFEGISEPEAKLCDVDEEAPNNDSFTTYCDIGVILDDVIATEAPQITDDRQDAIRTGKDGVIPRDDGDDVELLQFGDFEEVTRENMLLQQQQQQRWCTPPLLLEENRYYTPISSLWDWDDCLPLPIST